MHAAHSSSRSRGVAAVQPERRELVEHAERERRDVRRCARSRRSYWFARFMTLARRTSSNSGGSCGASSRSRKIPSRSPASVASRRSKPPRRITPRTTSAPARIRSARAGLTPGMLARSFAGSAASRVDQLLQAAALEIYPLHDPGRQAARPLRGGGEVADRAADAHEDTVAVACRWAAIRRARARPRRAR